MLYLVGTPIGNMADMSPRAVETLKLSDVILCEDTRVTGILLNNLGIEGKKLISYHEHNKASRKDMVTDLLSKELNVVQVSDAGMPVISDPGEDLVTIAAENGFEVTCIPGPTAAMTAAAISGIDARFIHFEGFLPSAGAARTDRLSTLAKSEDTLILYEAPHRIVKLCEDLEKAGFAGRKISFCRELTKRYEEVIRLNTEEAKDYFEKNPPKGEFVVVIEGYTKEKGSSSVITEEKTEELKDHLIKSGLSMKDVAKALSIATGRGKNEIYKELLSDNNN